VDVAKRLHDTETKKALLAMRLQRELRMKPHEAVAVAKSLLAQPAVSRMDLESINLRSLLSDHAEAVKVVCVVCLFSRKFAFIAGFFAMYTAVQSRIRKLGSISVCPRVTVVTWKDNRTSSSSSSV
jgi:hypothetical protein